MTLYMVEWTVRDLTASAAWYATVIGLSVKLTDDANGFILLDGTAGRLSLKRGDPRPGGVRLHFEVADLDRELTRLEASGVRPALPAKSSPEGYRRAVYLDPDGYEIGLFEWVTGG